MAGSKEKPNTQMARRQVEQLRRERDVKRVPISRAANDLKKFCDEHVRDDVLLTGFPAQKDNPYRPKAAFACAVL